MPIDRRPFRYAALILAVLLAACQGARQESATPTATPSVAVPVRVSTTPLATPGACTGQFATRNLSVATGMRIREIRTYASNGAGLAANDLDGDGRVDLVFASIDGDSSILWNDADMSFTAQSLNDSLTRAANIVDVNGDGLLDIVFTHNSLETVSYWRNQGARRFVREPLPGVDRYAYSMAWADLNGDGRLDLVTGAYDVDLKGRGVPEADQLSKGGVVLYEQHDGRFELQQLAQRAETLAIGLTDLNGDGQPDIMAANDFALPDAIWLRGQDGWRAATPFSQTSYSTMSIDWGDIANNGKIALLTTDMNPGDVSTSVLADWLPVISKLEEKHGPSDPQIMANMLQIQQSDGRWRNEAPARDIDATGWSWAGKFGDLDNDGYLDAYVVNGMIATNLFGHLPNDELVEENRAFHNRGDGSFAGAPEWGLGSTASGRGMIMADLNNDGRLDIVVNNLRGQAQLFENQLCGGDGLEVDLNWPGAPNTRAIGAQLDLYTSAGVLRRDVRAASGYLSGDPARVHFGFPTGTKLQKLVVHFPDGAHAEIDTPQAHALIEVTR